MGLFVGLMPIIRLVASRPPPRLRPNSICISFIGRRCYSAPPTTPEIENMNVSHARFVSEASNTAKWKDGPGRASSSKGVEATGEDFEAVTEGKGKLSPTSSHLFKLILPLSHLRTLTQSQNSSSTTPASIKADPPTVFLLHPSQPLSHVSRLIAASLAPHTPEITFRSTSNQGQNFQWSEATDVGDFVRDAARTSEFEICFSDFSNSAKDERKREETIINVEVPTFADRTRFLRRRLDIITRELADMEGLKKECDIEAYKGARRMAVSGLGALVLYWGVVARLTFWDYGWDIMEPITYLGGLSTVILGYLWFLYRGREVSYSSILHHSVSARREALYRSRGFDIDRWVDLQNEARGIKREIGKIAQDYEDRTSASETKPSGDGEGKGEGEGEEEEEVQAVRKEQREEEEEFRTGEEEEKRDRDEVPVSMEKEAGREADKELEDVGRAKS